MEVNKYLLKKLKEKDSDAFEIIYYEYKDLVYFVCNTILKNKEDAEEVTQDVFIRMINEIDKFDGRFFKAWILKIAKNLSLNKIRTRKEELIDAEIIDSISSDSSFVKRDYLLELDEYLENVEFEVVILHLVYNLKHRETAEYLNIPLGTVCTVYNNAIKKIKDLYKRKE